MPPKRFRNKNKHKNNQRPQNYTPNHNQNQNSNPDHVPYHQNQRNRGRSRSRSQSFRPWQKPHIPKHTPPKHTLCPDRPSFSKPQTHPTSPSNILASKATHTLRTSLFTAASGICKRRISLGLSLTLPATAASQRLKVVLLKAVEDARDCIVKMDFSCGPSTPVNVSTEVPVTEGGDDDWRAGADTTTDAVAENGWRDSSIEMDTDVPPAQGDGWDDVDAKEETVVGKVGDHGCVDLVREHGQLVQRMRWESSEYPDVRSGGEVTPPTMSQSASWSAPTAPAAPRKMSKGKKLSKNRTDDCSGGRWDDDEIM